MSTLDRMLSVLMAAREARNGSTLQVGSEEGASKRSRRSARRRTPEALAKEHLEQRQMLAVTVFSNDYSGAALPASWATIVAEPGDNVFVQQLATDQLYVADNSSFLNRTVIGGQSANPFPTPTSGTSLQFPGPITPVADWQLPFYNSNDLGRLSIISGVVRKDSSVLPNHYPMSKPSWTAVAHDGRGFAITTDGYRLTATISITQSDGRTEQWVFDNPVFENGQLKEYRGVPIAQGGFGRNPDGTIRSGVLGYTRKISSGDYYPTALIVTGNNIEVQWNIPYLPAVPTLSYAGSEVIRVPGGTTVGSFSVAANTPSSIPVAWVEQNPDLGLDSDPPVAILFLPNASGNGLESIAPSTFSADVTVHGKTFRVTSGHANQSDNTLFFEELGNSTSSRSTAKAFGEWTVGNNQRSISGVLLTGTPANQGRGIALSIAGTEGRPLPVSIANASYAVGYTRAGSQPVTATVWAGHDIRAALDINLGIPGSTVFVDSPVVVSESNLRRVSTGTADVRIDATTINFNATVSTPGNLIIGDTAAGSSAIGASLSGRNDVALERAVAVASITSKGQVASLTLQAGFQGAGYDPRPGHSPIVTISKPVSTPARASIEKLTDGVVRAVQMLNKGTDYFAPPVVEFSAPEDPKGRRATGTARVKGGEVVGIDIDDQGTGYTNAPTITLTPIGVPRSVQSGTGFVSVDVFGKGAETKVVFDGSIASDGVTITYGGFGYTPGSKVEVTFGAPGSGAIAEATVGDDGELDTITVTSPGSRYTFDTPVTVESPPPSTGTVATARAVVDPVTTRISRLELITAGTGYGDTPIITIAPPRRVNNDVRTAIVIEGDRVTNIRLASGTGMQARVVGVGEYGEVTQVVLDSVSAGKDYEPGDVLNLDSQHGKSGQYAQLRVLDVDPVSKAVIASELLWGGSGYTVGETLIHDGTPNAGYGNMSRTPRVTISPPSVGGGVQAEAEATLNDAGAITGFRVTKQGSGYSPSARKELRAFTTPVVYVESPTSLAKAESVYFNAAVAAATYTISLDDDPGTVATTRSTMYVSNSASLARSIPATPDDATVPTSTLVLEVHRGDVFIVGRINATKQSYLLQSDPADVMLFPFRFTTKAPGTDRQTGLIEGDTVAITLANDLPTEVWGGVATNDVSLQTKINSLRVRAAYQEGNVRSDPFPYMLSIEELDDLSIDAVAASGGPMSFSAVGNLQCTAVIDTAGDVRLAASQSLSLTTLVTSGKSIELSAADVTVRNTITARKDVVLTASGGSILIEGGTLSAGGEVRLSQTGKSNPVSKSYGTKAAVPISKGQTTTVAIDVADVFTAADVNLTMSVSNPNVAFLGAVLISPYGKRATLFDPFSLTGVDLRGTLFNDQAPTPITSGTAPYSTPAGTAPDAERGFKTLASTLSVFNDVSAVGKWQLEFTVASTGTSGVVESAVLTFRDPQGQLTGDITSTSTIVADRLVAESTGSAAMITDVNTVFATVAKDFVLADRGAVNVVSTQAGGTVWLSAAGTDPTTEKAALQATLLDVGSAFLSAKNGSVDVLVNSNNPVQLIGNGTPLQTLTNEVYSGMQAAGRVRIRAAAGSSGGDIVLLDAPVAGGSDKTVSHYAADPLPDATYNGGTAGLYLGTLEATKEGSLQDAIRASEPLKVGDLLLVAGGTTSAGTKANGVYTIIETGSNVGAANNPVGSKWKLRRAAAFDTSKELPSGSIIRVTGGSSAGNSYRLDYDSSKALGYTPIDVTSQDAVAYIGSDDTTDVVRFVVSTTAGSNREAGSLGKMIDVAQSNLGSQNEDFLFLSTINSPIKLSQELPAIRKPLTINGSRRWDAFASMASNSGQPVSIDGARISSSRTGEVIPPGAAYDGFYFDALKESGRYSTLSNMIVGGFGYGSAVVVDASSGAIVENNKIGFGGTADQLERRVNETGVLITAKQPGSATEKGPVVRDNIIGNSMKAGVVINGGADNVTLLGNTIGVINASNAIGIDLKTTGSKVFIGKPDEAANTISENGIGIQIGKGSGGATITGATISNNVISGISIQGGANTIGTKNPSEFANAIFKNGQWGILIGGNTSEQQIENNQFYNPVGIPTDFSTWGQNGKGAIGVVTAQGNTTVDYQTLDPNYQWALSNPTDLMDNQYVPTTDTRGPTLDRLAARSGSGGPTANLGSGKATQTLVVSGGAAISVKGLVLRLTDAQSAIAAATVVKDAFALSLNGKTLTHGTDYTFSYDPTASEVTLAHQGSTASFPLGRYVVTATGKAGTLSGANTFTGGWLTDSANNPLKGRLASTNVAEAIVLLGDAPGVVTAVAATPDDSSISVTWRAPQSPFGAPITNYLLEKSSDGGASWVKVNIGISTAVAATVSDLTNGTAYVFRVAAVNEAGIGGYSDPSLAVTPRPLASPPQNLQAARGDSSVVLTWAAPLSEGGAAITDYAIQKSTDAGKTWSGVIDGVSTNRTATVSSLTNGTAYLFRVATLTTAGQGVWGAATASVTPFGLPGIASNLRAVGVDGGAVLTWTAPASNGATISDYVIQKSTDGGTNWSNAVDGVSGAATTTVSGLTNGTAHVFRVAAVNEAGTGGDSDPSLAVTPRRLASPPQNLQATRGNSSVVLTWAAPLSDGGATITDYRIQQSVNGGTTWSDVTDGVSNATTATITGLTNGTTYLFQVAAVTSVGDGAWTAATTGVTPRGLASVPLNVQAAGGDGQVALSWSAPASLGGSPLRDYLVQSSTDGGVTWTDFTDGVVATTGATVTELSNGTSYMFRVAAVTDFETGTFSPATAAIVPLAAPGAVTDLRAVPSSGQVVLVWQAPSSTGGRPVIDYHVEYRATHSESWVTYSRVPSAATSATITGLPASSGYVFRVTAVTDYTSGLPAETTEPVVLVPQPTRVTGRAANGSVLLAWMPPKVNRSLRVIDYRIQYSADGGATWITASKTASPSARATVRGLMKGTGYIFRVAAVTAKGVGAYSVSSARVTTRRI